MINGGKIIGKASPLGDSGRLSRAASKRKNDVATQQAAEGMDRNTEVYRNRNDNVSQAQTSVEQKLQRGSSGGSSAGYEGGRSAHLEMDSTGYAGMPRGQKTAVPIVRQSINPAAGSALPLLFSGPRTHVSDYRRLRGNLK